ncbi:hypothetical protein [Polynucleobacter sp. MWH-Aus1W21]|uniref:hypothetical protein n=1 Tax=Polynucleobacter sp. MWH-Aus1W21 TaxID=1855880 RepID=UPI001BFDA6D8|nr:hypothetical protein [Polynucleobacter sp. MWH-Aus1W21]QWD66037.1 hypothetical protein ICW03_10385 [Polynucleobacter sp. MWH-Aus1W21]
MNPYNIQMTVAISKPLKNKNAIESAAFAIVCRETFSAVALASAQKVFEGFAEELPGLEPIHAKVFSINQASGVNADPTQYAIGVSRFHSHADGTHSWRVNIQANVIVVTCFDYSEWEEVWPRAKKYLAAICGISEAPNEIIEIGFQVIDKFVYESEVKEDSYSIHEVFKKDCKYLTAKSSSSGLLWHVYQGWFQATEDFPSSEAKTLHQLNLSSADETLVDSQRLATIIDHRASIRFMPETMSLQKLMRNVDQGSGLVMDSAFNQLRNQNKEIISELLTSEKLKSIGIG